MNVTCQPVSLGTRFNQGLRITLFCWMLFTIGSALGDTTNAPRQFPSLKEVRAKWDLESLAAVQRAAEGGDLTAQHYLAFCYASGERVLKDGAAAVQWYERASASGYLPSFINLGVLYLKGNVVPRDLAKAAKYARIAADASLAQGQVNLGFLYQDGAGVPRDSTEALKWWRLAAAQDHTVAMVQIGRAYRFGEGIGQDAKAAIEWFEKAAAKGEALAELNLGLIYEDQGRLDLAHNYYRQSAEHGSADAMWVMHNLYENGIGVDKDRGEAERWLVKSAELGNPRAQTSLGSHHQSPSLETTNRVGENPASMAEAIKWYRRAADQKWADGQYRLALCYLEGNGVELDEERGLELMRAAADQELPRALVELSELYARGIGESRGPNDEPMALLRRAEQIRSTGSYGVYNRPYDFLIFRTVYGIGTPRDLVSAAEWYTQAALVGAYNYSLQDKLDYSPSKRSAQWSGHAGVTGHSLIVVTGPGEIVSGPFAEVLADFLKTSRPGGGANAWKIAERFRSGSEVAPDKLKAWAWLGLAAEKGFQPAAANQANLERELSAQQLTDARQESQRLRELMNRIKSALQ